MKTKLFNFLRSFRASYWFVPTGMAGISIALSLCTTTIDTVLSRDGGLLKRSAGSTAVVLRVPTLSSPRWPGQWSQLPGWSSPLPLSSSPLPPTNSARDCSATSSGTPAHSAG